MCLTVRKPILSVFHSFVGFNVPELSKHWKRRTANISSDQLREFALDLSHILLEFYWERNHWRDIKENFIALFSSLSSYSEYLTEKNKKKQRKITEVLHLFVN